MTITWQGHSCFLLEQDGFRVVIDPYTRVPGYPALELEAHDLRSDGPPDPSAAK